MSAVEDIRIKLEKRLNALEQEIESLRSALTALDDEQAVDRPPTAPAQPDPVPSASAHSGRAGSLPPPSTRRRTTRRPRAAASTDAGAGETSDGGAGQASSAELERLLAETGGLTAVELARQTGTDYGVVLARIRQLEQAGRDRR